MCIIANMNTTTWTNPINATHPRIVNARQNGSLGVSIMLSWYNQARADQAAGNHNVDTTWLINDIKTVLTAENIEPVRGW